MGHLEGERRPLTRDLCGVFLRHAGWLAHTHTDGRCVEGISHTLIRAPRHAAGGNGTEREEEEREKELITALMLHFIIVS